MSFIRRGMEPPRPFEATVHVVCAPTREEAKAGVRDRASAWHPVTAPLSAGPVTCTYLYHRAAAGDTR